jgi:hypothetical protein
MAFRIRKPSQESFFALNAIPLYSYAIPLVRTGRGNSRRFVREGGRGCRPQPASSIAWRSLRRSAQAQRFALGWRSR